MQIIYKHLSFCPLPVQGPRPVRRRTVKVHGEGTSVMSWSPDDSLLIICGRDDNSDALVYCVEVIIYIIDPGTSTIV